jgi:hypothetical protein
MSEEYEREKLGAAVDALAASAAPLQKRLEYAFTACHTLMMHGFTDPERAVEFKAITDRLTADKSDPENGHVPTTCSNMTDDVAREVAQLIVDLNARLNQERIFALEDEIRRLKGR